MKTTRLVRASGQQNDRDGDGAEQVVGQGHGKIRPRARLIRTLGAELISSEVVAVIELVRNSYDADASKVEIRFTDPHISDAAALEIRDNGHGLTREVLLGPWLEPATAHKAGDGAISPGGRKRLGSKGVGRFATQRLGRHLTLKTRARGAATRLEADFDWEALDNSDRYLDELRVPWREIEVAQNSRRGASLCISRLNDSWNEDRFERLRLGLSRLVGVRDNKDEFRIELSINGSTESIEPAMKAITPMYALEGVVDAGGFCEVTYTDIAGVTEAWERAVVWPATGGACGPFRFRLHAWDLDREVLLFYLERTGRAALGLREFRRVIRDHAGISLYRDGFRILPYGEPDNDWLRLDRRRVNNPTLRLSNNQLLGWIELGADRNPELRDQTNREGLVANEAYAHLQSVVLELLSYLETRRFTGRRALGLARAPKAGKALSRADPDYSNAWSTLTSDGTAGNEALLRARETIEKHQEELELHARRCARQAITGQLTDLLLRQLSHPLRRMRTETDLALERLSEGPTSREEVEDISESVAKVARVIREVEERIERLSPLTSGSATVKLAKTELAECIEDVSSVFLDQFVALGIEFEVVIESDERVETDSSTVEQVAAVLLENAMRELEDFDGERLIRVVVQRCEFTVTNTGVPIPADAREQIFEHSFSTREDRAGLGLTLARFLLDGIGARISLTDDPLTTFRVELS